MLLALDAHIQDHNKGIYFQENGVHQSILEHQTSSLKIDLRPYWMASTTLFNHW